MKSDENSGRSAPPLPSEDLLERLDIQLFAAEFPAADLLQGRIGQTEQFFGLLQRHPAKVQGHGKHLLGSAKWCVSCTDCSRKESKRQMVDKTKTAIYRRGRKVPQRL
jgi:hypothetical protein